MIGYATESQVLCRNICRCARYVPGTQYCVYIGVRSTTVAMSVTGEYDHDHDAI